MPGTAEPGCLAPMRAWSWLKIRSWGLCQVLMGLHVFKLRRHRLFAGKYQD